jgi:hypothetical protein
MHKNFAMLVLQTVSHTRAENSFDNQAADRAYRAAFEGFGLPVLDLAPQEAAERIAALAIAQEVVAALDDWVGFVSRTDDPDAPPAESAVAAPRVVSARLRWPRQNPGCPTLWRGRG